MNHKEVLNELSRMSFGKYRGDALFDVPGGYLIWFYNKGMPAGNLKDYIEDNMVELLEKKEMEDKEWKDLHVTNMKIKRESEKLNIDL